MTARTMIRVALIVLVACASSSAERPATMPQPEVEIRLPGGIFFGSGYEAPATLDVSVTNRGAELLRVRGIEIATPGMGQYALYPTRRDFNEPVAPGQTKAFSVFATAYTNIARLVPTEPLAVRAIVHFEAAGKHFREVYFERNVFAGY